MSAEIKRCLVCGKEFVPCSVCGGDEMLRWRRVVCRPEHFAFHLILIRFSRGLIGAGSALAQLAEAEERYGRPDYRSSARAIIEKMGREPEEMGETEHDIRDR